MARIIVVVVLISCLLPAVVVSQDHPREVTTALYAAYNACKSNPMRKGDITQLQQALDAGDPVDAIVFNRQTLLMLACGDVTPYENQVEVVELLLNKGANPNIQTKSPASMSTPYHDEGQTALIKVVKNVGFSMDRSGKQKQQQLEIVELLLKAGGDVNVRDEKGMTALQYALQSQHTKHLVNVLMKAQESSKQ